MSNDEFPWRRAAGKAGRLRPGLRRRLTETGAQHGNAADLGFEATGRASLLQSHLEATAALVFACDMPEGIGLGTESSMSYVEWLRLGHGRTGAASSRR